MTREMKDSGIEWVGKMPSTWNVKKIKLLADPNQENSFIDGDWIESPFITDVGIRYYTTGNIGDGVFKDQGNGYISLKTFQDLNCKYAYPGDLVISRLNAPFGRACILPDESDKYVLAVDNVILRTKENRKFLTYVMQCEGYHDSVREFARGATMLRISRQNLGNIQLPIPPIQEQNNITLYLDNRCAKIDTQISNQEKVIKDLEDYRKSLIIEAVTKGLDPTAEMKDSGVEWVGEIPEVWEVKPLSRFFKKRKNTNKNGLETNLLSLSYGKIIRKDINAQEGLLPENFNSYNIVEAGDIIIRPTDLQNDKRSLRSGLVTEHGIITSAYLDLQPRSEVNSEFYHYLLHAYDLIKVFYNLGSGVRQSINYDEFLSLPVFDVDQTEQTEIVSYLDTKCSQIDHQIEKRKELIEKLKEYKSSLIYEMVTGKREVPIDES